MFSAYQQSSAGERSNPTTVQAQSLQIEEQDDTTPKAGDKRLFSNRESRQIEGNNYTQYDEEEPIEERHSDKRHRNTDWPLPSSPNSPASARPPLRTRNAPNSPSNRRRAVSQQRPSKFVEGSMNDRISAIPPTPYLDPDDELLSEYDPIEPSRGRKLARPRKFTKRNASAAGTDHSETSRHSIFRFGKSIAASFNPSNWKIWNKGQQQHAGDEESAQMRVLRERQSKAERIYRELKESGQFRDSAVVFPGSASREQQKPGSAKHDSGVEFGDTEEASKRNTGMSIEEKRKGRIFLEAPKLSESVYGGSPVSHMSGSQAHSNHSSPNKSSFHFKKPSLSNLKKTFASNSTTNLSEPGPHQARRIPSRKDLQKQQKLVKRVSDLEGKLNAARKQLSDALGEPLPGEVSQVSLSSQGSHVLDDTMSPPVPPLHHTPMERVIRKPFVPGALASLPSERLLAGYLQNDEEDEEEGNGIGMAVTVNHRQQSDEKPKFVLKSEQSPAWLGRQLQRPGSASSNRLMRSVEAEKDEDTTPTVKKAARVKKSTKSDAATNVTSIYEPSTILFESGDSEYADFEPGEEEQEPETGEEPEEEQEKTPKPRTKRSPPSKKRKSKFEGEADDGGVYKPGDTEESDPESEVKKSKSTPRRQQTSKTSTPKSNQSQAHKITLQYPRKLQKVSPTQAKDPNTEAPPTRAPPPPPFEPHSQTSKKHPARTSSLKSTVKSPPPANRLSKSRPPPLPTTRQQSASPPPSSAFTGVGPELEYKKPSLQRQELDLGNSAHSAENSGVPPMPTMPKIVRLASGEVIDISQSQTQILTPAIVARGKGKGSTVSTTSKVSTGSAGSKRRESKRLEKKRESIVAAAAEGEKKSFEWPDDVF
ncbi:uncharacterized protein LY89DRAFT_788564 [Mollisia scopiformis]|uniref:Nuclear RNA binding protein n=1 Tax=Mollisia scopiformis TaxID=149040 RepID=A0A132B9V0_MOLSC|nr:uncharacterized protein LY89DRAFT_788564 [Mollisia scopiformis]KUJ09178.1 hypothetical protein LY89DRAFT_788564 [Mollisia scopiformis]